MKSIFESLWPAGWIPSAADKRNGETPLGLLRMDNLTQDEKGILRIARGPKVEALTQFPNNDIFSIFSTTINGQKVRFVYVSSGTSARSILATTVGDPRHFNITLVTQAETSRRCEFLNVLGQIFMIAGSIKRKYDGTNNFPIAIPAPSPPTLTGNATNTVNLSNLDGGGNYTNWSSISSATYNDAGTNIIGTATPAPSTLTDIFSFETTYGTAVDTTNLGGTGKDTPQDLFEFLFEIDDATQIVFVKLSLYCGSGSADPTNYFWKEWDFNVPGAAPTSPYFPFNVSSGIRTPVPFHREDFQRVGSDATEGWQSIKAARVEISLIKGSTATIKWSALKVSGGSASTLTGTFNYVAVQVRDTGGFLEFSPASTVVTKDTVQGNITVTPAGAVDAQANQYWIFRQDLEGGAYYLTHKESGANGFTPAAYIDFRTLDSLIIDANINPLYTLQPYRTALPDNIIGLIWFRDRVIYLAKDGFIPSYKLDPGSYDSRFKYEIIGSSSEQALFIVKLDVGTFIVATTKDFYRVTGTFSVENDPNDPTGQVQFQDVNIQPLGISDPAISHAFVEREGTILYVSATGIRSLFNGTSTLLNANLDLLFRNEARYDLSPIQLLPCDQSLISMASQGYRIYISLPHRDGIYRTYVLNIVGEERSWRMITSGDNKTNPIAMCKEEDGTIIYGAQADPLNYIKSLENEVFENLPVKVRTQFNYGDNPRVRKDGLGLKLKLNTGGNIANLVIRGLNYDGSISSTTVQLSSFGDAIFDLIVKSQNYDLSASPTITPENFTIGVLPAIAYSIEISCLTNIFVLEWFSLDYEERPPGVRRAIIFSSPLDKSGRKRIGSWPFVADPMGLFSNSPTNLRAYMKIDGVIQPPQIFQGNNRGPQLYQWNCDPFKDILAYNWEFEVIGDDEFEFYKFLPPDITQETPGISNQVIVPATNFGKPNLKKLSVWPFVVNSFGNLVRIKVTVDQTIQDNQEVSSTDIRTLFWKNDKDIYGIDWEIEVICEGGMEFYKFMPPDILQVFPIGRIIDQIGPLDFNAQGLVMAIRFRIMSAGIIHYKIYDGDILAYEDDLEVVMKDKTYIVKVPKGIHPSVCRMVITADQLFYRFSVEYHVRTTGKETESKYIMVPDRNV